MAKQISASVGKGGVNRKDDSITVQALLNRVPVDQGGPSPRLAVDGLPWQKTITAIKKFQSVQLGFKWPDGRVDPNGKTLEKLNTFDSVFTQGPEIKKAYATIPEALARIRMARNRLFSIRAFYSLQNPLFHLQQERKIAEWNFKLHRANNPAAQLDKLLAVYGRMDETLFMASRMGASFQLFLPSNGHPQYSGAPAYTTLGGYYYGVGEKDSTGEYRKAIYITPHFANKVFAASILIHELAHYCGGKERTAMTIEHRASPLPPPHGRRLENGWHDYANMTTDEACRNAQSYQAYCYSDTVGRPPQ